MGTNLENLPVGGGGPQKAVLEKIAAAHKELATLFGELAKLPAGGVSPLGARKVRSSKA